MWHYIFTPDKNKDFTPLQNLDAVKAQYPNAAHILDLDDAHAVYIPANITDVQAEILLQNPKAIGGSGRLSWFEPWMLPDHEAGFRHNAMERAKLKGKGGLAALLREMSED